MEQFLDFEQSVIDVVERRHDMEARLGTTEPEQRPALEAELVRLQVKEKRVLRLLYRNLEPWQKTQVARHPKRPHASHYIAALIEDFIPIAGDRRFAEDPAMIAGIGTFRGVPVAVMGTEKGDNTNERVRCNFGMPKPEGYRKAMRLMDLAHRFKLPVLTFVDTPGAFPGVEAEARGQAEAIAACIQQALTLDVPIISVITGEGGSGGALAVATADLVLMLEHSIYSVISPEGCASILWRDRKAAEQAATALKLTAQDLEKMKVIDRVIKEPVGGAQRNHSLTFKRVSRALEQELATLQAQTTGTAASRRRQRFLEIGRNL